jgi:DNA-binding ferritin-like protein
MTIDIEDEIRMAAEKVKSNGRQPHQPAANYIARYDFVSLGDKVLDAMVQVAEEQLTAAQNKLEEVRAFAESIRGQISAKDRELAEMAERIKTLGERVLEANREFHAAVLETEPMPSVVTKGPRT